LCIDKTPRGTFGHIAASLTNQPLQWRLCARFRPFAGP
jgi:hypothetical protein